MVRMQFCRSEVGREALTQPTDAHPPVSRSRRRDGLFHSEDGILRFHVDYKGLDAITIESQYPLPLISEAWTG
jgi:hypothetical protein